MVIYLIGNIKAATKLNELYFKMLRRLDVAFTTPLFWLSLDLLCVSVCARVFFFQKMIFSLMVTFAIVFCIK